jgi:hypothetical protein
LYSKPVLAKTLNIIATFFSIIISLMMLFTAFHGWSHEAKIEKGDVGLLSIPLFLVEKLCVFHGE